MEKKNQWRLFIVTVFVVLALGYMGMRYVYYGSLTRNCIYSEKELVVPQALSEGGIEVTQPAYLAVGSDLEYGCLSSIKGLDGEVVGPEGVKNLTVGKKYWENNGFIVNDLGVGKKFKVTQVIEVTKHGIGTIDSGPGPIDYLILSDESGKKYKIATVGLGLNQSDLFLKFVSPTRTQVLEPENFRMGSNEPFTFTDKSMYHFVTEKEEFATDYDALKKNCDSGCCEQSVDTMKAHQYPRYIGKCPIGYQKNQLRCIQSITWCEPVASSSPAI